MLFVNTRPVDRAAELSAALSAEQINSFALPLLELQALPYSLAMAALYQQLPKSHVIVVVSPTAVEIGMRYLQQSGLTLTDLAQVQWVAVGLKTAQVLKQYGIQAVIPEVETSEGMLELPSLQNLALGSRIAFWRGEGGRQFMMQQLREAGMQIVNLLLYQRGCPAQTSQLVQPLVAQLQQHATYTVLISSEASWYNWLQLLAQYPMFIAQAQYMVLGQRLAALLSQYRTEQQFDFNIIPVFQLRPEHIIAQLKTDEGQA